MALKDKMNTAKEVLSNTKSRMIVIILVIIVFIVFGISYLKFKRSQLPPAGSGSLMTSVPNIASIPGLGQPTREYAKLQEQQNQELAAEADRTGTSAMPTIVRTTYLDTGVSTDLSKEAGATSVAGCGVEELKRARESGVSASELRCRGCSLAAMKAAGYSAGELRDAGFSAQDLKDAGFSASELKAAGYSAKELAAAGYSAKELAEAGFTAGELKDSKFSAANLRAAEFSEEAIKAVGFGTANKSSSGDCSIKKLQDARSKGVSATDLKKLGCSVAALRAAGYTASELKAAGFSAKELKDAGFSSADLRAAGFSAADLRNAGFSAKELKAAGFSAADLKAAGFSAGELRKAGFSADELKDAGFSASELKKAGFSATELSKANFTPDELKLAGYTSGDLVRAGVVAKLSAVAPAATVENGSCSLESLKKARLAGTSVATLKDRGCSATALKAAGFSAADLIVAGFSPDELKAAGFSDSEIKSVKQGQDNSADLSDSQMEIGRISEDRLANMNNQELDNLMKQQQSMMMTQATQLFSVWTPIPTQQYVQGEVPKNSQEEKSVPTKEQQAAEALRNSDIYKAGDILFAVLDTEVDSDEAGPVMATIIQGKLKGSKAIGNFQRVSEKMLLQFSILSVPKLSSSIAINAIAVDPNTSKTALASNVNNHYMMRYGTLFLTSFVSGLGQAFQSAGGSTSTTTTGTLTTMPPLNLAQKAMVGIGNVGQQFGSAMAPKVNMPPTVKIKAGISMGLMLTADLAVPKDQQQAEQLK